MHSARRRTRLVPLGMGIPGLVLLLAAAGCKGMLAEQNTDTITPTAPSRSFTDVQSPSPHCFCLPVPGQGGGLVPFNQAPTPPTTPGKCVFCVPVQGDSPVNQMSPAGSNNPLSSPPWSNMPGFTHPYMRPFSVLSPPIYQDTPGLIPNFPGTANYPGGSSGIPGLSPNTQLYNPYISGYPGIPQSPVQSNPLIIANTPFGNNYPDLFPNNPDNQESPLITRDSIQRLGPPSTLFPIRFGPQNSPFDPQSSPFGSPNTNYRPPLYIPKNPQFRPMNSSPGLLDTLFGPGNPQEVLNSPPSGPDSSQLSPGNPLGSTSYPPIVPGSSQFGYPYPGLGGPNEVPFGSGNPLIGPVNPLGSGSSQFDTGNPLVGPNYPLFGPGNSQYAPIIPPFGPQKVPFQPTSPPFGVNPFVPQLPPSQPTGIPRLFGPNLPPIPSSSQFGSPNLPFGPFSPQFGSPFSPFPPTTGPLTQMYPAISRPSYCPPLFQQLCSQMKPNFLAPMCAPGTSSSPLQPCISRSVNGICPPMTVCVSALSGGIGQISGGQNGFGQIFSNQLNQGYPSNLYSNLYKPQVNSAEVSIGQLASQISRQLGSRQTAASDSASGLSSSQALQGGQSSSSYSGHVEGSYGDQQSGTVSRRQSSPTATKVASIMRSLTSD
ncbi:hypothetical protein GE061_006589 [Apolygus lucorum]|uniref:Uncharacterized protein n=1 Tax=Apolygus lucorum TaxID=248454 RepID=A0A8S9WWW5_APOLU|nr:hypothetical protein GE061_006589 [Apolygus lucorum]